MPLDNIQFDSNTSTHGKYLRQGLQGLNNGFDDLNEVLDNMLHMIDGDGTSETHFTEVTARYGFVSNTAAKSGWDELNSVMFKLNTDTSVTSVNAAIKQILAKMK